ncbi:MAG TPA: hypothetical protein VMS38_08975 [Pseudorhodoferax sp.]|jgi:hypothetical protein|nr:hypothetical protein [Pseudorhodoferax sp.]
MHARLFPLFGAVLLLAGCEIPGIYPDPKTVAREADAKATGGGCRHALRALEDCYTLNPRASRAAIFAGWREMDQYMRENKIDGLPAVIPSPRTETTEESVAGSGSPEARSERRAARGS